MVSGTFGRSRVVPLAMLLACFGLLVACGGDGGRPDRMTTAPPGVNTNPQQEWVRCVCTGCDGLGDQRIGGCAASNCGDPAALQTACTQICANWGLTCTGATVDPICFADSCESCSPTDRCSVGSCFTQATLCDRACVEDSGCSQCESCDDAALVCAPPLAGNSCPWVSPFAAPPINDLASPLVSTASTEATRRPHHHRVAVAQSALSFFLGKTSYALDPSSRLSLSHPDASGSTALANGTIDVLAVNCPGPNCAFRLVDIVASGNDFDVEIDWAADKRVSNPRLSSIRPVELAVVDAHNFVVPGKGLTFIVGYRLDGSDFVANLRNDNNAPGTIDLAAGTVHLSGSFQNGDMNITLSLNGNVTNRAPIANAGPDQTVECADHRGTRVTLDGSASSDPPPGPGIASYLWFERFDRTTGTGVLVAQGQQTTAVLPLGRHVLTLLVKDGAGSVALDDVAVTIADSTPPEVDVSIADDCVWPPNHKYVRYELGRDIRVKALDRCFGDLSHDARILKVTNSQSGGLDGGGCAHTAPDVTGDHHALCIRAERCGDGDRVYAVTVGVADPAGNHKTDDYPVVVPDNPVFSAVGNGDGQHPITPRDLEWRGRTKHCGPEPSGAFIRDGDRECRFEPGQIETIAAGAESRPEETVAETPALAATTEKTGNGGAREPAVGCAVGGSDRAPATLLILVVLTTLLAARHLRRRGS